jgi:hypothetical protein
MPCVADCCNYTGEGLHSKRYTQEIWKLTHNRGDREIASTGKQLREKGLALC